VSQLEQQLGAGIKASTLHIVVWLNAKPTDVRRPTVPRGLLIQIKVNVRWQHDI